MDILHRFLPDTYIFFPRLSGVAVKNNTLYQPSDQPRYRWNRPGVEMTHVAGVSDATERSNCVAGVSYGARTQEHWAAHAWLVELTRTNPRPRDKSIPAGVDQVHKRNAPGVARGVLARV
jgi:hypothetical protein